MTQALADTSFFIADERGDRRIPDLPDELAVSVITIGELRAGVLTAPDPVTTARRLRTLNTAELLHPLPIDELVTDAWSELRVVLARAGRRLGVNDSWIAATAIANDLPLLTLDRGFDSIPSLQARRY